MSDNKKYYYLRLKENFFDSEELILLESMPDGYMYSNILLKLYLRSLKNDGKLMVNERIPYNSVMLANVTRYPIAVVEKAIQTFIDLSLIEVLGNGAIYLLDIQNFIGESSTEADRKRNYRAKIEQEKKLLSGQMSPECPDKNPPEIEIDIEKDIELDKNNITDNEREILNLLKSIENYRFDYNNDLEFIRTLFIDFPNVNIIEKLKEWKTWLIDRPLTKKSNARLQIRNWLKPKPWQKGGTSYGADKKSTGTDEAKDYTNGKYGNFFK